MDPRFKDMSPFMQATTRVVPEWAAANDIFDAQFPSNIKGADYWANINRAGANAPARDNPYSPIVADQTRAAQLALMQQMQNRMQNQSVAGQMGAQAMGQNAMAASAAMGGGPLAGRMAAGRMGTVGGGLMGQAAIGRMQENIGGLGGMFGVATGLRGQDLRSAADQAQAGLGGRALDDRAKQFYAGQGQGLDLAQRRAQLEYQRMLEALTRQHQKENQDAAMGALQGGATVLGGFI